MSGVRGFLLACALAPVTALACAPRGPPAAELRLVEQRLVEESGAERLYELSLAAPDGATMTAYLRRPAESPVAHGPGAGDEGGGGGTYGIVLVAGRETGREAAAIVPPPITGFVLAVEYPGEIPDALELGALVRRLREIRTTARRMPGLVRGAGHYLATLPEVDRSRVALVGVSFGVPFAAPAGRDTVFQGVALLYGGADLSLLFRTHLSIEGAVPRRLAARGLATLFRDLEPARHVGRIAPRPVLLINGTEDDWVPRESALRLRAAAREPVRHVWVRHGHLMPWHTDVMREMADSTLSHFDFLP
jgi:dienelactone hydrolase